MITLIQNELPSTNIDPEKIEEEFKIYLDQGGDISYTMSREDIEDLHMGFGDDLFHQFITTVDLYIDKRAKRYIDSFNEDFVPPTPEERREKEKEKRSVLEWLQEEYHNYRASNLNRGRNPKYIIMSKDVYHRFRKELEPSLVYITDTPVTRSDQIKQSIATEVWNNTEFQGTPICLYESPNKKNILDIV